MSNRVYVAGASSERNERAKPVIAVLRAVGFHITHDWTVSVDMNCGGNNQPKPTITEDVLRQCAIDDFRGVEAADIFVLLAPQNASTGAWVELGIALAMASACKAVYISGKVDRCIFALMPGCQRFETDEDLLKALAPGSLHRFSFPTLSPHDKGVP